MHPKWMTARWSHGLLIAVSLPVLACAAPETAVPSASDDSVQEAASAVKPPRDIATEIEASKSALRADTRSGTSGGFEVSETRYYVGNTLVLVEEVISTAGNVQSVAAYYFDGDRLAFFRGRGTRTIHVPGEAETREEFSIELGYDLDGHVVDSMKVVNGSPAELEPLDYEAPKARAEMLLDQSESVQQ